MNRSTAAPGMQSTIYLVDDDAAIRDALGLLLSLKGFTSRVFESAEAFLAVCKPEWRGCLLTDLRMPGMTGLDLQSSLSQEEVTLPVVLLTAHGDVGTTRAALKAGAFDFLEKPVDDEILVDVLRSAIAFDADNHLVAQQKLAGRERFARLTPREKDVAGLLSDGLQNREIAERLGISPRTVEVYKARMMEKLECRNLAELLRAMVGINAG